MVKLEKNNHLQLLPNNNGCKANNYNKVSQAKHNCTQYCNTPTPIPTSIVIEPTTNAPTTIFACSNTHSIMETYTSST